MMTKFVHVASDDMLRSVAYRREFQGWLERRPESRRGMIPLGTDVLNDHEEWGGRILSNTGEMIRTPPGVFDDVHGEDGSGVWISEQRRNVNPKRSFAKRLLPRIRLYDGIAIISGNAVTKERRRADVAEMRELLRRFDRVWRARYLRELRRIIATHGGQSALLYGADVRRLRLRFKAELDLWEAQER